MTDDSRALIERARAGDWDAIEDLISGSIAPTFDAALLLLGEGAPATQATEEALLGLLVAVRRGELAAGDPLAFAAKALAQTAAGAKTSPFASGLSPEDLVAIGRRPDDARRAEIQKIAPADRIAAVLAYALGLAPDELGTALGRGRAEIQGAIDRVLGAIPHEHPGDALRDLLDARAARARVPLDVEERVLDRFEKL